jgi:hypothetical protein
MRRIASAAALLAAALLSVLVSASAGATEVQPGEFTCPVCATKFTGNVLVKTDKEGGIDSDFCEWPKGTPALPYEVQVCPTCFYAARNQAFEGALLDATQATLKAALGKWKEGHAEAAKVEDLAPGQRWELAAVCLAARKAPMLIVGNLYLRSAWATRQCAGASFKLGGLGHPLSAFETLDEMEVSVKEEKDAAKQAEGLFKLAFGAHRAGDVKRRDATVRQIERLTLDETQAAKLAALKKAFDVEKAYQERTVACFREALEKEETPPEERHVYLFLAADMTRRLGDDAAAVKGYREVKASGKIRRDISALCDFFINYLTAE